MRTMFTMDVLYEWLLFFKKSCLWNPLFTVLMLMAVALTKESKNFTWDKFLSLYLLLTTIKREQKRHNNKWYRQLFETVQI